MHRVQSLGSLLLAGMKTYHLKEPEHIIHLIFEDLYKKRSL